METADAAVEMAALETGEAAKTTAALEIGEAVIAQSLALTR